MKITNDISGVSTVVLSLVAVAVLVGAGVGTYVVLNSPDDKNDDESDNGPEGESNDPNKHFGEIIQGNLGIGSTYEYKPSNRESTGSANALLFGQTGTHYCYLITAHDAKNSESLMEIVLIHKTTGNLAEPFVLQNQAGSTKVFLNDKAGDRWCIKTIKVQCNNGEYEIVEIEFYLTSIGTKQTCTVDSPSSKLVPHNGIPYAPSDLVGTVRIYESKTNFWEGELRGDATTKMKATVIGEGIDNISVLFVEVLDVQTNGFAREINKGTIPALGEKIHTVETPFDYSAYNKIGEEIITTYRGDVLVGIYKNNYNATSEIEIYLGIDDGQEYMRKSYSKDKSQSFGIDSTTTLLSLRNVR